ncbi:MAG: MFS transporter [Chitinophagaceae bacterium]
MKVLKPKLSFSSIINMNVGFFGLQYSFGLQQTNMTPIYSFLGANPDDIPWLNLAGPMTGLIVQPIVGAISDKTISKYGRRRPFFFIGAILCSICLIAMPFSKNLWMAASLLWILDAANNLTMEPYRALISDKLPVNQHSIGFLTQSFFTGLGITLANITPTILISLGLINQNARSSNNITYTTYAAFIIGAVVSISSIMYSLFKTKEAPLSKEEIIKIKSEPQNIFTVFKDIGIAIKEMPLQMKQLALVYFFTWYAMFIYWQFITLCLAKTIYNTSNPLSENFANAQLLTGKINATYNIVTFCVAFLIAWVAKKISAKNVHAICLIFAGLGLMATTQIQNAGFLLFPMIGLGIGWASMMGTPYVILAGTIPKEKTGVYMGILNMFIVLPMLIETISFKYVYKYLLNGNPVLAIKFAGFLILIASVFVFRIKSVKSYFND